MQSKIIFLVLNIILISGSGYLNQLHGHDRFHRGHHPGDQHSGHADPKYHGQVKHQGDSTHHELPFRDGDY